jgi:mono/diheme cytochrome c family protein
VDVKTFAMGFAFGTLVLILGVLAYLRLGLAEIHADTVPVGLTSRFLYSAVHSAVRRGAPAQQNPLSASQQMLIEGGKLYLNDCAGCHGEPGKAPSEFGATFYPPAPQLARTGTQYTEAQISWIAKHGIRRTGMAAQAGSYSDEKLWKLAAFIHQMTKLSPSVLKEIAQPSTLPSGDK